MPLGGVPMRTLLLVIAAVSFSQATQAEERTEANAFEFIKDMVTDGSWTGTASRCNARSQCHTTRNNRIVGFNARDQSYCQLTFSIAVEGTPSTVTRTVDMTRNFDISYNSMDIWFLGPVAMRDGKIEPEWSMQAPSSQVAEQVGKALQFIYASCHTRSPWETGG